MQSDIGCYSKYSEYDAGIQITLVWLMLSLPRPAWLHKITIT